MFNTLTFPEIMEEFIEQYKVVKGENLYCDGVEFIPVFRMREWFEHLQPKKGRWIENDNGTWSCNRCHSWIPDEQHYYANFCLYCGADMRNSIKPKNCFECEYSVDYSDDTVMCSEIKNMISTSQNRDMIPPFCPKYSKEI